MEIMITVLTREKKLSLPMDRFATINDVKRRIFELEKIDTRRQRLYACGKFLRGDFPLCVYDIRDGTNLMLEYDRPDDDHLQLGGPLSGSSSASAVDAVDVDPNRAFPADPNVARTGVLRGNASTVNGLHHVGNMGAVPTNNSGGSVLHQRNLKRRVSEGGSSSSAFPVSEPDEATPLQMAFDPPTEDGTIKSLFSKLEKLYRDQMKLKLEVMTLERHKEEAKARMTQLLQIIGRLEEERAAMRSIHYVRVAEIAFLKEQRDKLKNELEEEKHRHMCQICFCRPRDAIIFPCNHFQFCFKCLQKLRDERNTCPICRGPMSSLLECHLFE